jgi:hypothetical protein
VPREAAGQVFSLVAVDEAVARVAFRLNRDGTFAKSCPQDVIAPTGARNTANATDRRGSEKPRTARMRPLTTDDDGRRAGSSRQRERPLPYYHHMNHDEEGVRTSPWTAADPPSHARLRVRVE